MKIFKVFIFGLLYGVALKFIIDRIYRTDEMRALRNENTALQQYIHSLERQVQMKTPGQGVVPAAAVPPVQPAAPAQSGGRKDDLKLLKGVGPTIERRLNEAGIYTFAGLAQRTPAEVEQILGSLRRVSGREMIAEARRLAR